MSGFLNLLKVAQYHLVVILTLGADLRGDVQAGHASNMKFILGYYC